MTKSKPRPLAETPVVSPGSPRFFFLLFFIVALVAGLAQTTGDKRSPVEPLPQDSGAPGLKQMLLRLHTTARMLHTTAHPDDEDGGMMTFESRGRGATIELLTLNRGEGGQNKVGSNLFDVLGVLRTLELTASDRYYGVEQRFTRVADFGFSKSADETFQKWQGHDIPLADIVRIIRTFRPDVVVSRFGGTERDGHGHHQASGILTREAFRAAADPNRFPDQIREGLLPWQAKKFYIDNVCPFRSNECADKDYTIKLAVGEKNEALGMTYIQFAMQGLKHQLSQGAGGWSVDAGPHFAFYRLVDSVLPQTTDQSGHEKDFFDGIDTRLPALASRLGAEESKVPLLRPDLVKVAALVDDATKAADKDPIAASTPIAQATQVMSELLTKVNQSKLSAAAKRDLAIRLNEKLDQLEKAFSLATGATLEAQVDAPMAANADDAFMAVPGQTFGVTTRFSSAAPQTKMTEIALDLPAEWKARLVSKEHHGNDDLARFEVTVPSNAPFTRPQWHRNNPETDAINTIDDPRYATFAFPPPPVKAMATLTYGEKLSAVCMVKYKGSDGTVEERALAVAPAFSIALEPATEVIPTSQTSTTEIRVGVKNNITGNATLRLELPKGWTADPAKQSATFKQPGESQDFEFRVRPSDLHEGRHDLKAILEYQGKSYSEGYSVVTRDDLDTFYYYQPATQHVSIVDIKVPKGLKVGYIMGAGDDIPTVLQQVGMEVTLIPPDKLGGENLSKFGTIVLGIRAYDTQKEVVANNKKLLDYVSAGGTLLVQYETGVTDFNSGNFAPYPAHLSRARVSVEEAPVDILAPDDPIFHVPNQISTRDFDGWVQERGLYFMDQWDARYKALLSCHDPNEELQKGGLLRAQYGKGTYIYAGYAFFRQLPAGVPGAIRLYVNLLSAGHEKNN
jgi:LmbE family N-acetylglucosaminyl deacetylase